MQEYSFIKSDYKHTEEEMCESPHLKTIFQFTKNVEIMIYNVFRTVIHILKNSGGD